MKSLSSFAFSMCTFGLMSSSAFALDEHTTMESSNGRGDALQIAMFDVCDAVRRGERDFTSYPEFVVRKTLNPRRKIRLIHNEDQSFSIDVDASTADYCPVYLANDGSEEVGKRLDNACEAAGYEPSALPSPTGGTLRLCKDPTTKKSVYSADPVGDVYVILVSKEL
ncbi:MAG: hypothetical protein AAGB23_12390 [Pseudomonadota bacterium]